MLDRLLHTPAAEELRSFAKDIGDWTRETVEQAAMDRPELVAIQFRAWSQECLEDPSIRDWIAELSDEGVQIVVHQLGRFFEEFELDLKWLFRTEPPPPPALAANLREMVESYCQACRRAVESHDEGRRYRRSLRIQRLRPGD